MRLLAYGVSNEMIEERLGMAQSTVHESMMRSYEAVVACFESEYLRAPTDADMSRILRQSNARGFPGMLGSIDFSKWKWRVCPTSWQGQYRGKEKGSTVTLEAIADRSLVR